MPEAGPERVRKFTEPSQLIMSDGNEALQGAENTAFSAAALIYPENVSGKRMIMAIRAEAEGAWKYEFLISEGKIALRFIHPTEGEKIQAIGTVSANQWQFVSVRKETGTKLLRAVIYNYTTRVMQAVNGSTLQGFSTGKLVQVEIGKKKTEAQFLGKIAWIAAWRSFLSQEEMEAIARTNGSRKAVLAANPTAFWVFEQESVSEAVQDLTANEQNQASRENTEVINEHPPQAYYPIVTVLIGGVAKRVKRWVWRGGQLVNE